MMSGIIHFVSGKTMKISEAEFRNIPPKLGSRGIKCSITQDKHVLPLNSTTMEFIEYVPEVEVELKVDEVKPLTGEGMKGDDPIEVKDVGGPERRVYQPFHKEKDSPFQ